MIALALAAAAATGPSCNLPEPAAAPDAEASQTYLEVADSELAAGSAETAAIAYAKAFRLAPGNSRAREGFLAACAQASPGAWLREGRRLMDRGDRDAAIAVFERLRKGSRNPEAALLEGICRYEQGDDGAARALLDEAAAQPRLKARASYFLGLIDLRDGAGPAATARFDQAASDGDGFLAERAQLLRGAALRTGRVVLRLFAESGYDSNVNFDPDVRPATADAAGGGGFSLLVRPWGLSGPYLRGTGAYLGHPQAHTGDGGALGAQAGWRIGRGDRYLFAEYGFDASRLGGVPYAYTHSGRVGGRWQIQRIGLSAVYLARLASYQPAWAMPWSGSLQSFEPEIAIRSSLASTFALGYRVSRDSADQGFAASFEHGPRAWFRIVVTPTLRASAEATYLWRSFDAAASCSGPACPAGGISPAPRSDAILYLGGAVEKDLGRLTVRLSGGRRSDASLPDPTRSYSRLTATLTLGYTFVLD